MTTEVDYLEDIAAKMVKCPCATDDTENWCGRCAANFTVVKGYCRPLCQQCRNGSGRVLDPRFKRLRKTACPHRKIQSISKPQDEYWHMGSTCPEPDRTVVRDLAVLLEIIVKNLRLPFTLSDGASNDTGDGEYTFYLWHQSGQDDAVDECTRKDADTPLKAAAKAIWEWLEQEGKKYE